MNNHLVKSENVISAICKKDRPTNRQKILEWEAMAKNAPQVDIPVSHNIHGGMYAREITIPKDSIITGDIYKFDHFDIMVSGDITVSTDTQTPKRLTGFNFLNGLAGKKRAGYAHEDTVWITIHAFSGSTGDEIQKFITAESFDELSEFNTQINNHDYALLVNEINMTQDEIDKQVLNVADLLDSDHERNNNYDLYVRKSKIHGSGVFAKRHFLKDEIVCYARLGKLRTKYGRYANHALFANVDIKIVGDDIVFVASRDIHADDEITVNYRELLAMRFMGGDL